MPGVPTEGRSWLGGWGTGSCGSTHTASAVASADVTAASSRPAAQLAVLWCIDTTRWSLRTGERDVQQPGLFGPSLLLLDRRHVASPTLVILPEADQRRTVLPVAPGRVVRCVRTAETGDDRDRELETLCRVDGHDPQRVLTFVGAELDAIDVVDASIHPGQVLGQRSAGGIAPRPGLVDDVPHSPPGFAERPARLR